MLECLDDPNIVKVLSIGRNKTDLTHPKLTEIIHQDLSDFSPPEEILTGYDACLLAKAY